MKQRVLRVACAVGILLVAQYAGHCAEKKAASGKIVFHWTNLMPETGTKSGIYVVDPDGSHAKLLTHGEDSAPSLSLNGSRVVFIREHGAGNGRIYIMPTDGSCVRTVPNSYGATAPSLSPDGRRIAFVSPSDDDKICVMTVDGTHRRVLPPISVSPERLSWSPDGKQILFGRSRPSSIHGHEAEWDICVINVDGSHFRRVTDARTVNDPDPTWSPDGKRIAFMSDRGLLSSIYIVNTNGRGLRKLPQGSGNWPAWSPDGKWIAVEDRGELFIVKVDGTRRYRLTNLGPQSGMPSWSRTSSRRR